MQGIQVRLNPTVEQERWLSELADTFNRICRTGYQRVMRGALMLDGLEKWLSQQGLVSLQARNAALQIEAWLAMGRGIRAHQERRLISTIDGLENYLVKIQAERDNLSIRLASCELTSVQRKMAQDELICLNDLCFQKRRLKDNLARELVAVVAQSPLNGKSRVFGSRNRLIQRVKVGQVGCPYATFDDWRLEWNRIRNRSFNWIGEGGRVGGNQIAQFDLVGGSLTLRLTKAQADERLQQEAVRLGKSVKQVPGKLQLKRLVLTGLTFGPKEGRKLVQAQALGLPITVTVSQKLTASGKRRRALRLPLRAKDLAWYANAAFDLPAAPVEHTRQRGVLGVDLNAWGLAWCICTHEGNVMKGEWSDAQGRKRLRPLKGKLPFVVVGKSKGEITAQMNEAITVLTEMAETYGVAIAQEALDFSVKRWRSREQGPRYARMIHALKTSGFKAALQARCRKRGIAWHQVNPAWTSFVGFVKYGIQNRMSVDQAAAFLIARRAVLAKHWVESPLPTHKRADGNPISVEFQRKLKQQQTQRLQGQVLWHRESVRLAQPIPPSFQRKGQGQIDCSTWPSLRKVLGSERYLWGSRLYGETPLAVQNSKAWNASSSEPASSKRWVATPPPPVGAVAGLRQNHGGTSRRPLRLTR